MDEYEPSEQKLSKFDSTIAVLMRLDLLWKDCHKHARLGELMKWNWDLDRVWMELIADSNKDEKDKIEGLNKEISENKANKAALYNLLLKKEGKLREVEKHQGKGIGYQESVDEYIQK